MSISFVMPTRFSARRLLIFLAMVFCPSQARDSSAANAIAAVGRRTHKTFF
jgi:hypothetical protein